MGDTTTRFIKKLLEVPLRVPLRVLLQVSQRTFRGYLGLPLWGTPKVSPEEPCRKPLDVF